MNKDQQRKMVFNAIAYDSQNTQDAIAEKLGIARIDVHYLTEWLEGRGLVQDRYGSTVDNYGHELTEKGEAARRTGKPVEEALAEIREPAVSHVTNNPTFHGGTSNMPRTTVDMWNRRTTSTTPGT